jgi:hypothetical protein
MFVVWLLLRFVLELWLGLGQGVGLGLVSGLYLWLG